MDSKNNKYEIIQEEVTEELGNEWYDLEDYGEDSFFCCIFGGHKGTIKKG